MIKNTYMSFEKCNQIKKRCKPFFISKIILYFILYIMTLPFYVYFMPLIAVFIYFLYQISKYGFLGYYKHKQEKSKQKLDRIKKYIT